MDTLSENSDRGRIVFALVPYEDMRERAMPESQGQYVLTCHSAITMIMT